jgi:hypothetical protein
MLQNVARFVKKEKHVATHVFPKSTPVENPKDALVTVKFLVRAIFLS